MTKLVEYSGMSQRSISSAEQEFFVSVVSPHILCVSRIHGARRSNVVPSELAIQIPGKGCHQVGFGQTVGQGQRTTEILVHFLYYLSQKEDH